MFFDWMKHGKFWCCMQQMSGRTLDIKWIDVSGTLETGQRKTRTYGDTKILLTQVLLLAILVNVHIIWKTVGASH